MADVSPTRATIEYLRTCRRARAAGMALRLTQDPTWLLHQAINRRAGWPEDPGLGRGTCPPAGGLGAYPRRAQWDGYGRTLAQLARRLNTPRLIVREHELNGLEEVRKRLRPGRLMTPEDE